MQLFRRFLEDVEKIKKGEARTFDSSLLTLGSKNDWQSVVRLLESKGFVVAAVTKNFPTGVYCAEGITDKGTLIGWKLDMEKPESLLVTNLGWPFCSQRPEAPRINEGGLKFVPHHVMGVFLGTNGDWGKPLYLPSGRLSVFVADTAGIQYGQSGFEGCMTMRDKDGHIWSYRLDQNAQRFTKTIASLDLPELPTALSEKMMRSVVAYNKDYIPSNEEGKLYIRPSVAGLSGGLGLIVPEYYIVTVEIAAFGNYLPDSIKVEGLKYIHRPPSGANKIAPNYGASFKIKHGVKDREYNDYLSFDESGNAEEVSTCAIAFIDQEGNYIFPPVQGEIDDKERHILPSITRKSTIEILEKNGETVVVRDIHFDEISKMKGAFTMGNAVGILHVSDICLKASKEDKGVVIDFNTEVIRHKIFALRDKIYTARVGQLSGFEDWAVKV